MSLLLLFQGGGGAGAFSLVADPGAYTLTGVSATVLAGRFLNAEPATYLLTGAAATLLASRLLQADAGAYGLTGAEASLLATRLLSGDPGSYILTGAAAILLVQRLLGADPGVYVISGTAATLEFSGGGVIADSTLRLRLGGRLSVGISTRDVARDLSSALLSLGPKGKKLARDL